MVLNVDHSRGLIALSRPGRLAQPSSAGAINIHHRVIPSTGACRAKSISDYFTWRRSLSTAELQAGRYAFSVPVAYIE